MIPVLNSISELKGLINMIGEYRVRDMLNNWIEENVTQLSYAIIVSRLEIECTGKDFDLYNQHRLDRVAIEIGRKVIEVSGPKSVLTHETPSGRSIQFTTFVFKGPK